MSETIPPPTLRRLRTPAAKVGMILALLLAMLLPLYLVSGLVAERQQRQAETVRALGRGWGPAQTVTGPLLIVPYTLHDPAAPHVAVTPHIVTGYLRIPAAQLHVDAVLQSQLRRRGLFRAAIYTADVMLDGNFVIPDFTSALNEAALSNATLDWQNASFAVGASDLRDLPADTQLTWNGTTLKLGLGLRKASCGLTLTNAPAPVSPAPQAGAVIAFKLPIVLRGTQAFHIMPTAMQSSLRITSSWFSPSYDGLSSPTEEALDAHGFAANWNVAGDPESSSWQRSGWALPDCAETMDQPFFTQNRSIGVELREAVPVYLMVERAQKYGVLFLALSFLTLFLFEAVAGVPIHVVQYGLLGLSVSLFALLLVSAAEPLGFAAGYAVSTAAVLAQASLYTLSVTRRVRLAATFAGVLSSLFGFLYVVLSLDAYALLAGTVALFTILSVVMVVTRRVNWSDAAGVA